VTTGASRRAGSTAIAVWLAVGALTSQAVAQSRQQASEQVSDSAGRPPADAPHVDSPLSSSYPDDTWRDLPLNSPYELAEMLEPTAIVDRFTGGGLATGQPIRVGGFSGSWSQTLFRIDGVNVTDPTGSGAPLLFPELSWWRLVRVNSGTMALDTNAPGVSVDFQPRLPTARWAREVSGSTSHFFLTGKEGDTPPAPIARLNGWDQASMLASGPLVPQKLGAVFGAAFSRASEYRRAETLPVDEHALAAFAHLVATPNDENQIRAVALLQRVEYPFDQGVPFGQPQASTADTSVHLQGVWERQRPRGSLVRAVGGYTRRQRTPDFDPTTGAVLERLVDGPVGPFAFLSPAATTSWTLGAAVDQSPARRVHALVAGADLTGGSGVASPAFGGTVGELVNGTPARLWVFRSPGTTSARHEHTFAGWVGDRMTLSPTLQFEAGLHIESSSGSADRALDGVTWWSWLPRASVRWSPGGAWRAVVFGGYTRTTDRLLLDYLAVGDPAASTADVYRWQNSTPVPLSSAVRGPLVARVGPGTAGDAAFSAIDSNLRQPTSDEVAVGVELRPLSKLQVRVRGFARRVQNLLALVDYGAPIETAYSVFTVQDPGGDVLNPQDDRLVPVYNRLPASFGADRYVLTNQSGDDDAATYKALEISLRFETDRFLLFGGGAAGIAEGPAGSRGFGPIENDQATLGELGANPNAATFARGRFFTDRAFTGKLAMVVKLPSEMRLGLIARYQDGQSFARMLILTLNQGVEAVRAFANGDSRFTFVGTLDARFQKRFVFGDRTLTLLADAYNVLNLSNSVEEDVAAGPNIRLSTAVQPPRSFHVGLRVGF